MIREVDTMQRVLIADKSSIFASCLSDRLNSKFEVHTCSTGIEALEMLASFEPEIIVLDVTLTDTRGVTVLNALRSVGRLPHVVALTYMTNERAMLHLSQYEIDCVLSRPCSVDFAILNIQQIAFRIDHPLEHEWSLENEINALLITLGFRMGLHRYDCVACAIRERYNNPDCAMKELYIDVAKQCGGTPQSVEKAIRDGIECAYKEGNPDVWAYYFMTSREKGKPFRGSENFIAHIAACIHAKKRLPGHIHIQE